MDFSFQKLIDYARQEKCSDVHITVGTAVALRQHGRLRMLEQVPTAQESREMIFTGLTQEQIDYVESGKDLDVALMMEDGTRLRANIYHQRNNLAATYRILQSRIPGFDELEIPEAIRKMVNEPRGLVLVTGPTGSGKTTTLASMIDYINRHHHKHVITVEDPIEYVYYHAKSMIHQREIGKDVDSFSDALHSALREDPDIILVGEMRDYETIKAAITAAETGHLVFSTLHTSSAAQTVERILDAYPPHGQAQARTQLANVLKCVSTQVLVPLADGDGRVIATEIMVNNEAIANQIRDNKTHQITGSIQSGTQLGMHTLNMDLRRLEKEMRITRATALEYCNNTKDYESLR